MLFLPSSLSLGNMHYVKMGFCVLFYSVNPDVLRRGRRLEYYLVYGNTTRNRPKTIVKQNQSQKLVSCASQNIVKEVSMSSDNL
jgi:hypothetical protein